jgi:hypothetical protein
MGRQTSPEGERNRCPGRQFTGKATRLQQLRVAFLSGLVVTLGWGADHKGARVIWDAERWSGAFGGHK